MANIAFYGSHNASYVIEEKGKILAVVEVERLLNLKNSGLAQYLPPKTSDIIYLSKFIPQFLMDKFNITEFDNCFYLNSDVIIDEKIYELEKNIPAKKYSTNLHHRSHAAGCFYQSPYQESLVFSFDGGGNDGKFNIYHATRKDSVQLLQTVINPIKNNPHIYYDLGFPYMIFGHFLNDIKKESLNIGNLVYPGKIMGLASYGNVVEEWLPYFIEFYKSDPNGDHYGSWEDGHYDYEPKLKILGGKIGLEFNEFMRFEGEIAYNIAATSQRAFEECFLEIAKPYFEQYPDLPICITGGCGLNIIFNTRLVEEFKKEVFVGPNPNDCGIALGLMLDYLKPQNPIDVTYSGLGLLDIDSLATYLSTLPYNYKNKILDLNHLSQDIIDGLIIGIAHNKSEHGPRALGNRSIICNPSIPEMKDTLNAKVKHREWYRPFAPVVRLEDVSKYFEFEGESRWMSFCPKVKPEWRDKLAAITHIDNTARVQTVTREQNEFLYDLLTEFEKKTGVGVLLNTSFNVDGKPILSTVKDAFNIFQNTDMDGLVIENTYIRKLI